MPWRYFASPLDLLARARRNPDFFRAIRNLTHRADSPERIAGIGELTLWLFGKQLAGETRNWQESAKGFPAHLHSQCPDVCEHLQGVPHLGALAPLALVPATRLDYVALLTKGLLIAKQKHPGLGLGSGNFGVKHGDRELTGLEIVQSWASLSNYGHLFGTFATERLERVLFIPMRTG